MKYIVSKKYKDNEYIDEKITFNNLQNCLNKVLPGDIVYLSDEIYYGKVYLRQKDITIIGSNESVISYDAYNSLKIRKEDGGDNEKVYGTTGSATFTLKPEASGFKMYNVIVENTHQRDNNVSNQAVAFKTEAIDGYYEECKFISCQDTLYVDNNDNIFKNCLMIGTVDFIFGKGNAIFDKCNIVANTKGWEKNFLIAPNTYIVNSYGFLFYECKISIIGDNDVYLGRPWFDKGAKMEVVPRALFYKCIFPDDLILDFIKMREEDSDNYELYFYQCRMDDLYISNIDDYNHINFYEKIYNQRAK